MKRWKPLILILLCGLLSGCFDLEQTVKINSDGSGVVSVTVTPAEGVPISAFKDQRFLEVTKGKSEVKAVVREGKFQHREFVEFRDLREVGFENEVITLRVEKRGLIGFRTHQVTFEHVVVSVPEKQEAEAAMVQGMAPALAGHFFTYSVELPGAIGKADVVRVGDVEVEPTAKTNTASWMIPLELLIGPAVRVLTFKAVFEGDVAFPVDRLKSKEKESIGPVAPRLPIVIVSIDEDSFDELNLPWPWPRDLHALLVRKLAQSQARIIAFDILFLEPKDSREDQALTDAIKDAGNVILGALYKEVPGTVGSKKRMLLPTPLIREHAVGYGPVNLITDSDGVVRRAKLAVAYQNKIYPHFAYRIYQAIVGKGSLQGEKISTASLPINFRGPARSYPIVPYYRIVRDEIDPSLFKDKIVLVGAFAPSLHDVFPTAFSETEVQEINEDALRQIRRIDRESRQQIERTKGEAQHHVWRRAQQEIQRAWKSAQQRVQQARRRTTAGVEIQAHFVETIWDLGLQSVQTK